MWARYCLLSNLFGRRLASTNLPLDFVVHNIQLETGKNHHSLPSELVLLKKTICLVMHLMLRPWRLPRQKSWESWIRPWATWWSCGVLAHSRGVGLDGLERSVPILRILWIILWFKVEQSLSGAYCCENWITDGSTMLCQTAQAQKAGHQCWKRMEIYN